MAQFPTNYEPSMYDLLNLFKRQIMQELNCHGLAQVQSFNSTDLTITAKMMYSKTYYDQQRDGTVVERTVEYPLMLDVPIVVLGGGNARLTFPIAEGDECLILFNDRDIDKWFQGATSGPVKTNRLHSFADGVALIGFFEVSSYDTARAKLSNGDTYIGVSETKVKVANSTRNLNTVLQSILTQLQTLANTTAVNGSPINPTVATQLSTLAGQLGELLE